ncbi:hypothetical protein EYF80_015108 [Liparis tanakae]|uniref:Uncharacterized protein n=1 Tax=Liparis tanakae TaxID=230148 RepID=A0A4Z2I9Y2_9TELE|nr:hypothetical protein EYF80_015108 [Liparis tanakae]
MWEADLNIGMSGPEKKALRKTHSKLLQSASSSSSSSQLRDARSSWGSREAGGAPLSLAFSSSDVRGGASLSDSASLKESSRSEISGMSQPSAASSSSCAASPASSLSPARVSARCSPGASSTGAGTTKKAPGTSLVGTPTATRMVSIWRM